ncbi:MAG: Kazal-type serine protease inhibitor domain-containing protein [Kofleriaceae bacterium]
MRTHPLAWFLIISAACAPSKQDAKGVVDDSTPPAIPSELGKADAGSRLVAVDVQSEHPYANNSDGVYAVPLTELPSCASSVRLHFSVLRTETAYDFVTIESSGESFDGNHDDTWTEWIEIEGDHVNVKLDTDSSITRHGFAIDQIEWSGSAICPAIAWPTCDTGTINVNQPPPVCGCPQQPQCAALDQIEIKHSIRWGRNYQVHHTIGANASETHPGKADEPVTTEIATIDLQRLGELVLDAAADGILVQAGYDRPVPTGEGLDELVITAGSYSVTFAAGETGHDPKVAQLISNFEALFTCGGDGALTCGDGFTCLEGACTPVETCFCPAIYDPVCGSNGHTYSNSCAAGCALADIAHDGECGIAGDPCGSMFGLACLDDYRCRFGESTFEYPYPDAGGSCVERTYCDAPSDCTDLPHPAVLGSWACNTNTCAWQAGPQWQQLTGGAFETAHPYASSTSVWKAINLPAGAQALRLITQSFNLETNYDFLEVWSWRNGAWVRDARYTGTTGPAATDEFSGRYHYLRFVSDSSVVRPGFRITSEWR